MAAERENFYILLDLDPAIQDWDKIEAAIGSKRSDWSRDAATSPSPKRKRQAGQNKALLPEIERVMKDPELRRKEANQAVDRRKALREHSLEELRRDLAAVCAKGHLLDKELEKVIKRYTGEGLTEEEIRREISVQVRPDNATGEATVSSFDKTILNRIRANLSILGCANLYQFLGVEDQRGANCGLLRAKATEIGEELRKYINKTTEVSARQELVGLCSTVFATEDTRKGYDYALGDEALEKVEAQFDLLAGDTIDPNTFQVLLKTGMEAGATESRCRQRIREMAKQRKFIVETAAATGESYRQCGHCLAINQPTAEACHRCGRPLQLLCPMPNCKRAVPSTHQSCTGCGFPIGNLPEIQRRLARATAHLDRGDLKAAQVEADAIGADCVPQHSGYPPLHKLRASILEQRRSRDEAIGRLRKLVDDSLMEEASRLLGTLKGEGPLSAELSTLQEKIGKALTQAEQAYKAAIEADTKGKRDDAFSHCCRSLAAARDYRPARQLMAKFPPDPPSSLEASADRIISLSWKPSPSQGALEYKIVRKEGARPSSPADGESLAVAAATRFDDTTAEPGATYYYAVLTVRGGVESSCCLTGPLMAVADVADLSAKAADKCVELSWQLPKRAVGVEVWRQSAVAPAKRGQGDRIEQARRVGITDHNVTNGVSYGYLILVVFRAADGSLRASRGLSVVVKPEAPARPLMSLAARRNGSQVVLHWQPPSHGTVEVYRFPEEPTLKVGQQCDMDGMSSFGKKLPVKDRQSAEDELHGENVVFYLPVTVTGSIGVIGRGLYVTTVEDVTDLRITVKDSMMLAKWIWPRGCRKCRVAIRSDQFSTSPEDAQASRDDCLLSVYETKGGFYTSVPLQACELFVTVYAAMPVADQVIYASGSESARRRAALRGSHKRCELRYRISLGGGLFSRLKAVHVTIHSSSDPIVLPELCVVAKSRTVPTSAKDGKVIAAFPAGQTLNPGEKVAFKFTPGPLPKDTLARLFAVNNQDADWLTLVPEKPRMEIGS